MVRSIVGTLVEVGQGKRTPPICLGCWQPAPEPPQVEPLPPMGCTWFEWTIPTRPSPISRKELFPCETDVLTFVIVSPTIPLHLHKEPSMKHLTIACFSLMLAAVLVTRS